MVAILPPPPIRTPIPLTHTLPAGTRLVRLYAPTRHGQTPTRFRAYGPLERFDHHRPGPGGTPCDDPDRAVTYAGLTLACCIVEIFGDSGEVELAEREVALLTLTRALVLLDLRGGAAMRAGTNAALAKTADRPISQAWSRYFYESPAVYGWIDGLIWHNAHNDEEAVALYERAANAVVCHPGESMRLDSPALRPEIVSIALAHNLVPPP